MRTVVTSLCLAGVLAFSSMGLASEPTDPFVLPNYVLAFVDVAENGTITNEYVSRGETLEDWKSLIAVRVWPNIDDMREAVGGYYHHIQDWCVETPAVRGIMTKSGQQEVILEAFLAPQDKSYLEYTRMRFMFNAKSREVTSYQFSRRIPYDLTMIKKIKAQPPQTRFDQLAGTTFDIRTNAPTQTTSK